MTVRAERMTGVGEAMARPLEAGARRGRPWLPYALAIVLALAGAALGGVLGGDALLVVAGAVAAAGAAVLLGWPDLCVPLVMFILWSNAAGVAVEFHGVPSVVGMGLPALLLVPIVHRVVFRRERLAFHPVQGLMLMIFGVQLLGSWGSSRPDVVANELKVFATEGMLLFFLVYNAVRTRGHLRAAAWAIIAAGLFLGVVSSYQQATGTFDNSYGGFSQVTDATFATGEETVQGEVLQKRLGGPLRDQNRHSQNMLLVAILGLFVYWGERRRGLRLLALAATLFSAIGSALTFSRGGAVAFVMVLGMMVLLRLIKVRHIAAIALGAALVLALVPQYSQRLVKLEDLAGAGDEDTAGLAATDGATRGRLNEMISAGMAFADHPLVGVGPGMFRHVFLEYSEDAGFKSQLKGREAHNLVLGIAADLGGLGLSAYVGVFVLVLAALYRERRRWLVRDPPLANLLAGLLMMVVTYLATGVFLHLAYERFFWSMMALACAAATVAAREGRAAGTTARG